MATAAAAMAARARREVEQFFLDKEAFSPEHAVEFEPRMPIQRRYLEQLIAEDILHEVSPGRYWFDRDADREMRRQRFVWTMRVLAVAAAVFVVLFAINVVWHFSKP